MSNSPADQIVWIDCEMTGLDVEHDKLCEVAVIVTDFELQPLHPGFTVVIDPGEEALASMGDFVRNMHEVSGLLKEMQSGVTVQEAEDRLITYLETWVTRGKRPLVGGNTIGMDRRFISRYLPKFDERLHYRSIDVSTIKELSRRWHPQTFSHSPEKHGGHRALADIAESIRELAYFRQAMMVPSPGIERQAASKLCASMTEQYAEMLASAATLAQDHQGGEPQSE